MIATGVRAATGRAEPKTAPRPGSQVARGARGPILIVDDMFPHPLSAFRLHEFVRHLERYPGSTVLSDAACFRMIGERRTLDEVATEFYRDHPHLESTVRHPGSTGQLPRARAVYAIFLNTIWRYLPLVEQLGLPFAFTLYPGGGLHLADPAVGQRLRRVCASRQFRGLLATQPMTRDYLLERGICPPELIAFHQGAVLPPPQAPSVPEARWEGGKPTFDVAFVAMKYTAHGRDKGFDVFVDVAERLAASHPRYRFHVVGGFGPDDHGAARRLGSRVTFHGYRTREFFPDFHARLDLLLSPGDGGGFVDGAFDGFPTGAATEAAMAGVPVLTTDPHGMNRQFVDGEEIVIVRRDAGDIADLIRALAAAPDDLRRLRRRSTMTFLATYAEHAQLSPRYALIERAMASA